MAAKNIETESGTDEWAHLDKAGKRRLETCRKFSKAMGVLADRYGWDMLNLLMDSDRKVRLTHSETLRLAAAVSARPDDFKNLGQIIRAGNTKLIRQLMRTSGAQK